MSTRTNFTETLGIISIILLFSSTFLMFIGIFYYPLVWIGLMLFITGILVSIYALCETGKQSNEINKIIHTHLNEANGDVQKKIS